MTAFSKDKSRFVEAMVGDEAIIMLLDDGDFFSISGSALSIWNLIDGRRDREAILAELSAEYNATPGALLAEVESFIAELSAAGLVVQN